MVQYPLVRWLHISDFHVGKDEYAQRRIFDKIQAHVQQHVAAVGQPDMVFITGDLVQSGVPEEYKIFYDEFLLPLLFVSLGDNWQGKVFTVPGNHDVNRSLAEYFDREAICLPKSRMFDPNAEGRRQREIILPRFQAYMASEQSEGSDSPKDWLTSELGAFVERLDVNGHLVGVVGINTAWLCKGDDDRHALTPGVALVEEALARVKDCQVRILLGHHPLDWLHDDHVERVRALLGECHVIYLHGHLHQGRGRREDGAGHGFLAIQSGACFQARDGEKWINGLLWAELDQALGELRLQPRQWNPKNRDWPTTADAFPEKQRREGTDWWCFPLPDSQKVGRAVTVAQLVPEGWQIVDRAFLDNERRALSEADALRFFDGSIPGWRVALAPEVPQRQIVGRLATHLRAENDADVPVVVLLLGPGGEGKSTAIMQTLALLAAADPSWKVLWRKDENAGLSPKDLRALPRGERWLIATDNADLIAADLFNIVKAFKAEGRRDAAFLLTCRDTDWRGAVGKNPPGALLPWSDHAAFHTELLSGLNETDARDIVRAWSRYGQAGLGQLAGQDEDEAVRRLVAAAKREAALEEGSFFGAMLNVRIGQALREHLERLLERLQKREIHSGVTLLDAFGHIAAMHAEGLLFLSRPVLAYALGCHPSELKQRVLGPLGKEAAAVGAGQFVLTRHRTIALTGVRLLSETFQWDCDEGYLALAKASIAVRRASRWVPELHKWDYDFPEHFLRLGRTDLGLGIAKSLLDAQPDNIRLRVNLAKLYRRAGVPDESARLFREYPGALDRAATYEWGIAESECGDQPRAAWLQALSLADQVSGSRPDNKQAMESLLGLYRETLARLFAAYNDRVFVQARTAIAVIGLALPFERRAYLELQNHLRESEAAGLPGIDVETAFEQFELSIKTIASLRDPKDPLALRLAGPEGLSFHGLRRLIDARRRT